MARYKANGSGRRIHCRHDRAAPTLPKCSLSTLPTSSSIDETIGSDRFRGSSEIVERLSQAPRRSTTGMDAKVSSNIRSRRSASPSRTEEPDQDAVGNGFSSVEELREDSSNHDDVIKQEDLEWRAQGTILELFLTNLSVRRSSLSSPSASIFRTLTNGRCRAVHRFNRISRASSRFFYNFTHLPID